MFFNVYLPAAYSGFFISLLTATFPQAGAYDLVRQYSGLTFFDEWDFYGSWDNLTLGDVNWLSASGAFSQSLAYINSAGNAILKVDNMHSVPFNQKRNSVRITTKDSYAVGSLWIIDLVHLPFGCSVWPAFWTVGPTWPDDGEIDIIEAINLMPANQYALHTTSGCFHNSTPPNQIGSTLISDCSTASGCTVAENQPNSFGAGFAGAGGGVWATQFDVAGIFIWFWSRQSIPKSITQSLSSSAVGSSQSGIDLSDWGPPSASYLGQAGGLQGGCNITEFFSPQKLVLDITLCGNWAGLPEVYNPTCGGSGGSGTCYTNNVVGSGSNYNDAYFEIPYIRAYTTGGAVPTPTAAGEGFVGSKPNLSGYGYASGTATTGAGLGGAMGGVAGGQAQATGTSSLDPNGILHPSPMFFPGNGAASDVRTRGTWGLACAAVILGVLVGVLRVF